MAIEQSIYSLLLLSVMGALAGAGLGIASKIFKVVKNKKLSLIEETLPGLNCGACGFGGCSAYATAILGGGIPLNLCKPGGSDITARLSEIMGVETVTTNETKMVPQVHCRGRLGKVKYEYRYSGYQDCNALFNHYGGNMGCKYGCLGLGSCIRVCPVGAISYDNEGCVWVDKEKCISCGKCIEVCPTGAMRWVPYSAEYIVACNSPDKGGQVKKYCQVGCTGCGLCAKKTQDGSYVVENFLSKINYEVRGDLKKGAEACPRNCIIKNEPHSPFSRTLRVKIHHMLQNRAADRLTG